MPVRESPDELTHGAEEVGTWKSCINVDHIAKERWGPPLVDADWHAFCQAFFKDIEGEDWGWLHDAHKEMSRAVGIRGHRRPRKQKPSGGWEQPRMREKNTMIQSVKTTSLGQTRHDQHYGKSTSKTRSWHWTKL